MCNKAEIIASEKPHLDQSVVKKVLESATQKEHLDMAPIEKAFSSATSIVLGKSYNNIKSHQPWLEERIKKIKKVRSVLSGRETTINDFCGYFSYPEDRIIHRSEAQALGAALKLNERECEQLTMKNAGKLVSKIALLSTDEHIGDNINLIESQIAAGGMHLYRTCYTGFSKYCGSNFWPRDSEYIFGSSLVFSSSFCIRCHSSTELNRCFEVDTSRNCNDSYYLHNCENVGSSILCFNAKNLRYAIGNMEVGKEKFMQFREMLLHWLNESIEKKGKVPLSIFEVGCIKRK